MNIHEVEHIVGLSKKSIRYYEENGLLSPKRNKDNDYRVYSDEDLKILKIIKFLRELGVSIKELQLLKKGNISLQECMLDRINKINSESEKYGKVKNICLELANSNETFENIKISREFEEINILNKEGFTMRNIKTNKTKKIIGAIIPTIIFGILIIIIPVIVTYIQFTQVEKIPWIVYIFVLLFFSIPIIGLVYNLIVRIREINRGEEDEASKY